MMRRRGRCLITSIGISLLLVPFYANPGWANPGDLDRSFSGDGTVTTSFREGDSEAYGLAIQSNGRIVAAGLANRFGDSRFAVARYKVNGSLDGTFSGDGKVTTDFSRGADQANDVALLPNGKVVAAGCARWRRFAVARYRSNGTLDPNFDGDGKVTTNFLTGEDVARGVAVQSDWKIVAAGRAAGSGGRFALVRYWWSGNLDQTFGGDGKLGTNFTAGDDFAYDIVIQPDGRIVAAGIADTSGGAFALARYTSDGSLDTTFGDGGKVVTDFTPPGEFTEGRDAASAVAIQADGKIVAAGVAALEYDDAEFALARYNSDGTLDGSFGDGGKVRTHLAYGDSASAVAMQADGKIVVSGTAATNFTVVRYNSDGTLDASFGDGGVVFVEFPVGFPPAAYALAIQSNGRILAAGTTDVVDLGARFAVARLLAA